MYKGEGIYPSGKHIAAAEILDIVHFASDRCLTYKLTNVPKKVLLEYTFALDTELRAQCIET